MERVSAAAGPVGLIKVRILPHVASPEKWAGHGQDQAQGAIPSAPEGYMGQRTGKGNAKQAAQLYKR